MKPSPAQLLADLLSEAIDPEAFYQLVRENELELAPRKASDPRAHAERLAAEALALLAKDWGLRDLLIDGAMTALKGWYDEGEL